ncbi:histidine--tRNA ligase [Candidatus Pacearchaeota archaeon]|nr:histidine--tRNA ligase [Candidatus Pacearchaeota archaeon]
MKIEIDTVKGFQDYLPPESLKRNAVKKCIERWYKLYGFVPIETPFIEFDESMRSESLEEDEAVSDRFRLKDKGGRNLGLRYEFTFQLARILKQNPHLKLPFRRYQIGEVFRDEPTGPGRFRQFTQCDADIIGDSSASGEAECISLIHDILKELKITAGIYVNNRKLLSAIIESVQIGEKEKVMREIDKLDKIGEDHVKANIRKYAETNQILTLFKLLEKPLEFFIENAFDGAKEIEEVRQKAKRYGAEIIFSPMLVRGLDYYTGNILEVKHEGKNTIAAGGRYDKVVGKYLNQEIPAFGISFGLERITELAKIEIPPIPQVMIISLDQDIETIKLAKKLRKETISCITSSEKVGKSLEYANSLAIPFVIFLGREELAKKKFKLKNMKSGEEKLLSEKQLLSALE